MNNIQQQEQKIQLLRVRWVEASPGYKKFIEAAAAIEKEKLEELKNAPKPQL